MSLIQHPDDETLQAYADGRLPESESESIFTHLSSCEKCALRVSRMPAENGMAPRRGSVTSVQGNSFYPGDGESQTDESQSETVSLDSDKDTGTQSTIDSPSWPRSAVTAPHPAPVGLFGDYELLQEVGRGGMGIVYRALQRSLNRTVALKMIRTGVRADDAEVRRFHAEARTVARLDHPNIVPIYEIAEQDGQRFFSMAFVEGQRLDDLIKPGPLDPREAAKLVDEIVKAVDYAHRQGVVHRDRKPANILVDGKGQPYITDFGLAKQLEEESDLTARGQILGTPNYMSPEQAAGELGSVDSRSDIYALGVVLYQLMTAELPFRGTPHMVIQQVLHETPRPPRRLNEKIPLDLEAICLKAMSREPNQRYESAKDLGQDLQRFLRNEAVSARTSNVFSAVARWCRRTERIGDASTIIIALSVMMSLWEAQSLVLLCLGQLDVHSVPSTALTIVSGMLFFSMLTGLAWKARFRTLWALWGGLFATSVLLVFAISCGLGWIQIDGLSEKSVRIPVFGFFCVAALVVLGAHAVALTAYYANQNTMRWTKVAHAEQPVADGGNGIESSTT